MTAVAAVARLPRARSHSLALLLLLPIGVLLGLGFVVPIVLLATKSLHSSLGFGQISHGYTLESYRQVLTSPLYRRLAANSLEIGGIGSVLTCAISYPVAYFIRFVLKKRQNLALLLVTISLFAGFIVKVYTWRTILGQFGLLNTALKSSGLIHHPLGALLFSKFAVIVVVTYLSLPVVILILVGAMQNVDPAVLENARDLGASGIRAVGSVLVPLTMNGIVASLAYGFIVISGDYVTPQLVGGTGGAMIGVPVSDDFVNVGNAPVGSAVSITMLVVFVLVYLLLRQLERIRSVA